MSRRSGLAALCLVAACHTKPAEPPVLAPKPEPRAEATPAPPPAFPEAWRTDDAVAYSCRNYDDSCTEWLVTNPRVGSPAEAFCAKENRREEPCPHEDVAGICDESRYFGTVTYRYAPETSDDARARCEARFWPDYPVRGQPGVFEDPEPLAEKQGCTREVPPALPLQRLCLDLPADLPPASYQDPRYDPPLNPPPGRTIIGQFMAGYHQVFVYRRAPLRLAPSCPDTPTRRGSREARDANFIQVEASVFVQGEWLEVACLSPVSEPERARRMCTEGVLRWCGDAE